MAKKKAERPRATELEWLRWFFAHADFGPADGDVQQWMRERFMKEAKKRMPEGYEPEE